MIKSVWDQIADWKSLPSQMPTTQLNKNILNLQFNNTQFTAILAYRFLFPGYISSNMSIFYSHTEAPHELL